MNTTTLNPRSNRTYQKRQLYRWYLRQHFHLKAFLFHLFLKYVLYRTFYRVITNRP
jgi:hypothetical protein